VKVQLREDYQVPAVEDARAHIRAGAKRILINSPTGSGKTVMASALMELIAAKGNRANFVVDRLSLIQQTSDTFDRYGLDHGVIQADHPRYIPSMPLQVCSVQTLAKRGWPEAKVDMIDEAHVLYQTVKDRMQAGGTVVIGFSATPFTRGLGKFFDAVINVTTTNKLIADGWLSPYRIFSCAEPDMSDVRVKSTGEWDEGESSKKALQVVGDVVLEYTKHGNGRKFICSAVDTVHVQALQSQFLAAGINVASYTYKDAAEDRAENTVEFRKPNSTIRGLITVTAASWGFDVPDVSCIIEARPLRADLAGHIQLLGRGLRIAEGKTDCLILDHSGNCARFWGKREDFFENGIQSLDMGERKKKEKPEDKDKDPIKCPSCGRLHNPMPFCPHCGHEYPRRAAIQHVPGTLKELIASKNPSLLREKLWPMVCSYVLDGSRGDALADQRRAQGIYASITGSTAHARIEHTKPVTPTPEVYAKIKYEVIRYAKAREAARRAAAQSSQVSA